MNPKTLFKEEQKMTTNESKQENLFSENTRPAKPISTITSPKPQRPCRRKDWLSKFCEARFDVLRQSLNSEDQVRWDNLSFDRKCSIVQDMVRKGSMA